jgi:signal transduction histidine kinase/CheY-like chemotaxis protein
MDLIAPDSRAVVDDYIRRESTEPYEVTGIRKDGSTFIVEARGQTLVHYGRSTRVTIIRDITERKRQEAKQRALTERMRHAQKLESLGVLAGGVAHDFNNILTIISNGIALAKRGGDLGPLASTCLDTVAVATERAADLCRQMLAYAGKASLTREAIDLNALVSEMASMLEVSVSGRATLVRALAPGLPTLRGDLTQIRQIVMNLVLNASEAIETPHGTVHIATGSGIYDAATFSRSAAGGEPKSGPYVFVEVRDDGVGMDASTLTHLFDPFFTTKFLGRGLGMATVLGIVRGHDGAIEVDSTRGQGTRIRIYLPAAPSEVTPGPKARPATEFTGGHGVILLVDDEKNVRITTKMLLEGLGFEVLTAGDGPEAIQIFEAQSSRIGVVLLDLTMPRMDGVETLGHLRRLAPHVPIVLTSGHATTRPGGDSSVPRATGEPDAILEKPYSVERLLAALEKVMRRPKPSS